MIEYLLKSTACLLAFYLFYRLFLEKDCMHVFKRLYLIATLILALLIPLITFTEFSQTAPITSAIIPANIVAEPQLVVQTSGAALQMIHSSLLLLSGYLLGLLFFALRFSKNLIQLIRKIRSNPKLKTVRTTRVLLSENVVPHTFLRYIFLNKSKYETHQIPEEVLLHEETHAKQLHSIDVLFIELLQIAFWFNPLIYLFKKTIRLNHEFLADRNVISKGVEPVSYLNMLLAYSAPGNEHIQQPDMANAFNYSSIKKRFTVMKTRTSKKIRGIKILLLMPLTAVLLYSFSTTEIYYKKPKSASQSTNVNLSKVNLEIKNDLSLWLNDSPVTIDALSGKMLEIVSPKALSNTILINTSPETEVPSWLIAQLEEELGKLGIKTIQIHTDTVQINEYQNANMPIIASHEIDTAGATKKQLKDYALLALKYNAQPAATRNLPLKDLKTMEGIYLVMSPLQKAHAEPIFLYDPDGVAQKKATPEMVAANDGPAKKTNAIILLQKSEQAPLPVVIPSQQAPKSQVEFAEEMANKNAEFSYNGKKIAAAEAIKILGNSKGIRLTAKHTNRIVPKVELSDAPVTIQQY